MKHSCLTGSRAAAALSALILLTSLSGCWKKETPETTGPVETPPVTTAAPTETAPIPSTSPIPETTAPAETQAPTTAPTVAPTEAPTEAPTIPEETEPAKATVIGTVNTTRLNIRKNAGTGYTAVGSYYKGDQVEILETKDGWGRTDKGWVFLDYLDFEETIEKEEIDPNAKDGDIISNGTTVAQGYLIVNLEKLNVRTGPGTQYEAIATAKSGQRYAYYQERDGWVRIEKGWIYQEYIYIEGKTGEGAGTGTIHSADPNVRSGPGLEYEVVDSYKKGDVVKILAQFDNWGYTEKGWVSMSYVGIKQRPTGTGTVNTETLNIRKQARVDSTQVGTYQKDDRIEILEVNGDWGKTDKGWVHLDYVTMDGAAKARTVEPVSLEPGTGIVTADALRIRTDGNIQSEVIGSYAKGDKVEILEVKDGWGRTDRGWIYLEYVKMN